MLSDKLADIVKKLPGVSYVLAATTYLGARATGVEELAGAPLVVACGTCALGYWIGSRLDRPIYDKLYGPKSRLNWLPKHPELREARDELAKALFGQRGALNYEDALKWIPADQNLYSIAKFTAEGAKAWEGYISKLHDLSKAARSLLVISLGVLILLVCASALPDAAPDWLTKSMFRLGFWSRPVVYGCLTPVFLVAYIYLRALHHLRLYKYVSAHVKLLPLPDGRFSPVIPEITV